MGKSYLSFILLLLGSSSALAQNVSYTPLHDNTIFNRNLSANPTVGSTSGAGTVSENGAAVYRIPLIIPPGTNGVTPKISVEYNSLSGPGILGAGWHLGGLSVIARATRSLYFDDQVSATELSVNDRFSLDGTRLVLKSGSYGGANSTYGGEAEDFSTVTAKGIQGGGPQYFEVLTKDGVVMEFGNTPDSRFMDISNTTVLSWRLNKVRNPDGNYIEFKYTSIDRDVRIDEILYTGNAAAGLLPYNKIKFAYKVKSDINTSYEAGSSMVSKYLLDKIAITTESGQLVRSYQFNYGWDNINSYLKEVTETGSDGTTSLNATVFKYGDAPQEFVKEAGPVLPNSQVDFFSADFDGNGRSDLVLAHYTPYVLNTPSGAVTDKKYTGFNVYRDGDKNKATGLVPLDPGTQIKTGQYQSGGQSFLKADFTGDGLDDLLTTSVVTNAGRESLVNIKLHKTSLTPDGLPSDALQFTPVTISRADYLYVPESRNYVLSGDFDGDGKQDLFTMLEKLNPNNTSAGFEAVMTKIDGNQSPVNLKMVREADNVNVAMSWAVAKTLLILDFNGDGKDEIMTVSGNLCEIHSCVNLAGGNSYFKTIYSSGSLVKSSDRMILSGDFNGDGKTDLLYQEYARGLQNNLPWFRAMSTGTGFVKVPFAIASSNGVLVTKDILHTGDFNGDGRTDFYHQYKHSANQPTKADVYYSTNDAAYTQQFTPDVDATYGLTTIPFDLNGDGRAEIVMREANLTNLSIIFLKKNGKEHLLEKTQNGVGLATSWKYANMSQGAPFYTKGSVTPTAYPFHSVQLPLYLVSFFDNRDDGFSGKSYMYEDAKLHRRGKGFLGFKKVSSLDFITGYNTINENEFSLVFFARIPKQTTVNYDFSGPSVLVDKHVFTNELVSPAANRFWVKTTAVASTSLGDIITSTTNIYDNFGNVTKSTVNTHNVETVVTDAVFGAFPGAIPNKATSVTVATTRTGQATFSANTAFVYNALGQLTSKTEFNGLPKSVTTSYEYFPLGNLKKSTLSPAGPSVSGPGINAFTYDAKGRYAVTSSNALTQSSSTTYDPKSGGILSHTGINGLTTSRQYDVFGRLKKTTMPEGYSVDESYSWDISGNAVWRLNTLHPGRPDTKVWFDKLGREVKKENEGFGGQAVLQTIDYDFRGNIIAATLPQKAGEDVVVETREYDEFNRVEKISTNISPNTGKLTMSYNYSSGNLVTTTTRTGAMENQVSSATTDPTGKIVYVTDDGGDLAYTYFSHGGVKEVKSGGKTLVSNAYDVYGRQSSLTDINAGTSAYVHNALGELVSQTTANGNTSTMQYDLLGRVITRSGTEGNTAYEYYPGNAGASVNQLKKVAGFSGNVDEYTYDNFGRVQTIKETIDGVPNTTTLAYNIYGDVTSTTYPSGFGINKAYDANGYPTTIKNSANSITIYNNTAMNGRGQVTKYALGNGLTSTNTYVYGFPTKMETPGKQNLNMVWDYGLGLLTSRNDAIKGKTETLSYDKLDRLKTSVIGAATQTTNYAPNGNINSKTDAGAYNYHATRINAVTNVTNPAPSPIPLMQQDITYTPFMQPENIAEEASGNVLHELTYTYGVDYQRIKGVAKQNGSIVNTRYYFQNGYEKDVTDASTKHVHYISGPSGLASIVVRENGADTYHYVYTDHLGSINTVTNSAGAIMAEQSFDAWGRRRNPSTWAVLLPTAATGLPAWLYRGYTGHEHLDRFGLINMNGRLYDPVVGRMLSPDNVVPDAGSTQGYNRYTYAMNNPLIYTDPDGENPILLLLAKGAFLGGASYILSMGSENRFDGGRFAQSLYSGAFSAGMSFGIGEAAKTLMADGLSKTNAGIFQTASHAIVQGAMSMAQDGNFKSGLAAGLFGSLAGSEGRSDLDKIGSAVLGGGLSAQANGGIFWQGAAQAGIVAAFNHAMHDMLEEGPGTRKRGLKVGNSRGLKGRNIFSDRYTGPDNPHGYILSPLNDRDAISMQHDKDYDLYNAIGANGLLLDGYVLPADARFVKNQFRLSMRYLSSGFQSRYPLNILLYRESVLSLGAGTAIGLLAIPKFIFNNPYRR